MVHHLFADLLIAGILRQVGDIAVHVAIHFDMLHHLTAICLQATVEVVEVLDSRHAPCCGVEELGGDSLRQRVIALLLPSRHQVVAIFGDHPIELRDLIGGVLKVGIHRDHYISLGARKTGVQRRRFAIIA